MTHPLPVRQPRVFIYPSKLFLQVLQAPLWTVMWLRWQRRPPLCSGGRVWTTTARSSATPSRPGHPSLLGGKPAPLVGWFHLTACVRAASVKVTCFEKIKKKEGAWLLRFLKHRLQYEMTVNNTSAAWLTSSGRSCRIWWKVISVLSLSSWAARGEAAVIHCHWLESLGGVRVQSLGNQQHRNRRA